jgi:hypothetical protein
VTEANALATEAETNATTAEAAASNAVSSAASAAASETNAAAVANFKGEWSTLTGAINIPSSVLHNGMMYMLVSNLADVTASEPGVSSDWLVLNGLGGGVSHEGSTDISLTLSSQRFQRIVMTTAGNAVFLPDPATLSDGPVVFMIVNAGEFDFDIKEISGDPVFIASKGVVIFASLYTDTWNIVAFENLGSELFSGTPSVFESASALYMNVAALSATQALVTYRDGGNSDFGTACILDISGSTVTPGTPAVFESASSVIMDVAALSATKALVVYRDVGNSNFGTACVLDVSGSTVTPGTPVVFESATTEYASIAVLSPSKVLVAYEDDGNSYYGTACVLDISGSTVTPGTAVVFESATLTTHISATALSPTQALVVYRDGGNSDYGTACVLDVSGSTVTPGTPAVFESAITDSVTVTALSTTQALVVYRDVGNAGLGTACLLNISGSTVTPGTPVVYGPQNMTYQTVTALSAAQAMVTYVDVENSNFGTACVLDISGSTVTPGTPVVFAAVSISHSSAATLSEGSVIEVYRDGSLGNYGLACTIHKGKI